MVDEPVMPDRRVPPESAFDDTTTEIKKKPLDAIHGDAPSTTSVVQSGPPKPDPDGPTLGAGGTFQESAKNVQRGKPLDVTKKYPPKSDATVSGVSLDEKGGYREGPVTERAVPGIESEKLKKQKL